MIKYSQTASDSIKYQIKFLKLTGLWYASPREYADIAFVNKSKLNNPRLYSIYSLTLRTLFVGLFILPGLLYISKARGVEEITKGLFVLMQVISIFYKTYHFLSDGNKLKIIANEIRTSSYFVAQSNVEEKYLKMAIFQIRFLTIAYYLCMIITMIIWMMLLIISNHLPFPAKYPYLDNENPKHFYAIASLQIIGTLLPTTWICLIDSFYWASFAMINYGIRVLGERILNIGHYNNNRRSIDAKGTNKSQFINNKDAKEYYYKEFINNIEFHKYILSFTKYCENVFANTIFLQMPISTIILCSSAYQLLIMPINSIDFYSTGSYALTICIQMFSYTYLGNEIIYSSRRLSTNAYFSNFLEFNKKTSAALLIFLIRTTLFDISVTAGEILRFSISLETFVMIMKSSYTYLAVLRELD